MGKQYNPAKKEQDAEALKVIFREDSGKMPDLSKLDRHRSDVIVWITMSAIAVLFVVLAAVWVGFSVFKPSNGNVQGLELSIDGPEKVTLGQEMTYTVKYRNISAGPLASTELRVSFPPAFTLTHADRAPTGDGLVWRLGAMTRGESGEIQLKGIFLGALGTQTAIQVVGTYRPGSFNSDFKQLAMRSLEYTESVLSGVIAVPEKILPGDKVRIVYEVNNQGTSPLTELKARMTLPAGFVRETSSTDDVLDESMMRIDVGTLDPGASTTVSIVGTFASGASGDIPIHAEVGRETAGGGFQALLKTDATAVVLAGDLRVHVVINGSDANRSVGAREPLHIAVAYENTSPEEIKGVTLRAVFEPVAATSTPVSVGKKSLPAPSPVDWSQLDDVASGTVQGNALTWSKDTVEEFERLAPQADGVIEFSIPVAAYASGTPDVPFQISVQATMTSVGKTTIHRTIATKPIIFRLRSDADLSVEARYFSEEGAQLGAGPLPPIAGQTTTYRIGWLLQKTLHELTNIRVSAVLPKNALWPSNAVVSAGDITYDAESRTVTWTLNRMPADVGEVTADFDVQLTPSQADVGRFADLFGETRFEATDVAVNEAIVRMKPALSTDLRNDEDAKSKGVVRKP